MKQVLSAVLFLLAGCGSVAPAVETQSLAVYATPAAQPWLADVYACAPEGVVLRLVVSPAEADLTIRLGEPDLWLGPVYQIGSEDLLVLAHPQSPWPDLTLEQTRALFAGTGESLAEVWVYAQGEDEQMAFEQAVMSGRAVTSLARLAVEPLHMSEMLSTTPNAIGFLPRRWMTGNLRTLFVVPQVPVLALAESEPQGALGALLACLQS